MVESDGGAGAGHGAAGGAGGAGHGGDRGGGAGDCDGRLLEEERGGREGARGGKQVKAEQEEGLGLRATEEWGDDDMLRNPLSPLTDSNISFRPLPRPPVPEP